MIVGVDPGTTVGYAVLDTRGNVLGTRSSKQLELNSIVEEVVSFGSVLAIGTDKQKCPQLIEKIAELVEDKKVEGIAYVNDESDRNGMRMVIRLKIGAVANVVLNTLFKMTLLQSSFSVNNIALVDGRPRLLNLKQMIKYFVRHRHDVIIRRAQFELEQAQKRAHILEALLIALDFIDEVIAIIRSSKTVDEARTRLMERFTFSEAQASAIVEMRLRQLTGLEREKLQGEYNELMKLIAYLNDILSDLTLQMSIIKEFQEFFYELSVVLM